MNLIGWFRAFFRFFIFLGTTCAFLTPILTRTFIKGFDLPYSLRMRSQCARLCMRFMGVRVDRNIPPAIEGPCIYVGNHRSYIDPVAVIADIPAMPVAKAEVSSWPLIGFAARATGVMYVKRDNKQSRKNTLEAMADILEDGHQVLIYPEGTTSAEPYTLPMRFGAFKLASDKNIPIVPIAIEYPRREDSWIGNDSFLRHFFHFFSQKRIVLKMEYGQPIYHADFNELVQLTRAWIDGRLSAWSKEKLVNLEAAKSGE